MANRSKIVGLTQLKNKVKRNAFDLTHRHMFTAQFGELLPVFTQWCNPGETFKLGYQGFTRTAPLQTAAFTRLRENIQYFFVPLQSTWKYFESTIQNMTVGQSGENISRIAESSTSAQELSTSLPYVNYNTLKEWISDVYNQTLYYMTGCYNALGKDNFTSENILSWYYDNHPQFVPNRTWRFCANAKLLGMLGYGNFSGVYTYNLGAQAALYMQDKTTWNTNAFMNSSYGLYLDAYDAFTITNAPNLSVFPLLCYHKIINDYYRYYQWQAYEPWTCNIDYIKPSDNMNASDWLQLSSLDGEDTSLIDIELSNLPLDYLLGVLPRAQYGEESAVSVGNVSLFGDNVNVSTSNTTPSGPIYNSQGTTGNAYVADGTLSPNSAGTGNTNWSTPSHNHTFNVQTAVASHLHLSNTNNNFTISALRSALALQKYKEVQNSNDADFCEQVLAHFGVKPKHEDYKSYFIGGADNTIAINPEVNTNLTSGNAPDIKATATGQLSCSSTFTADTYGIIIGIYRCTPILDYSHEGIDRNLLKTDASDFPIPELDSVGMQTQYRFEVSAPSIGKARGNVTAGSTQIDMATTYGYLPRYAELKTSYDRYEGAFNSSLRSWVTGLDPNLLFAWRRNYSNTSAPYYRGINSLLKATASLVSNLFVNTSSATVDDDKLWIGSVNTCVAVRPFSVYGLPWAD